VVPLHSRPSRLPRGAEGATFEDRKEQAGEQIEKAERGVIKWVARTLLFPLLFWRKRPSKKSSKSMKSTVEPTAAVAGASGDKLDKSPEESTWPGGTVVEDKAIGLYVDAILNHPDSVCNNPLIPDALEKQVYILVVNMVLEILHMTIASVDRRQVFGMVLTMAQSRGPGELLRSKVNLPPKMIESLVEQVMVDTGKNAILNDYLDRLLYQNIIQFAMRLIIDIVASMKISTFGLNFTINVEADPEAAAEANERTGDINVEEFEEYCEPLIQNLLNDPNINIAMIPDNVEMSLYKNVARLIFNIAVAGLELTTVDVAGIRVEPDL